MDEKKTGDTMAKSFLADPVAYVLKRLARRRLLDWLPDAPYLRLLYRANTGRWPRLKRPRTYNEKMQWLKLHDRKPLYTQLVDKFEVRRFVSEQIGEEYLIPLVGGPWESFDQVDFDALPEQFVLKCTHDSGGLVICRDKAELDVEAAHRRIAGSLERNYFWGGREWPYKDVPPRIIAEAYMEDENATLGLTDYKFFCFGGTPRMLYVSQGLDNHATANISFFDLEGREMPFRRADYRPVEGDLQLPESFPEMRGIAERLSRAVDSAFVRIDLYSVRGRVYFSEITFTPCSGMIPFDPPEWDEKLGEWIVLPEDCG